MNPYLNPPEKAVWPPIIGKTSVYTTTRLVGTDLQTKPFSSSSSCQKPRVQFPKLSAFTLLYFHLIRLKCLQNSWTAYTERCMWVAGLPTVQFLITYRMQKQRGKAWSILSHEWHVHLGRQRGGGVPDQTKQA